ncbi:MAG: PrsW family glutamic-type intramembrane protease [Nitrososphaeria archaeon]
MSLGKGEHFEIPVHKPSIREQFFFLLSGMIISVPLTLFINTSIASFLEGLFHPFYIALLSTAILAPITEEFAKSYPLFYRHGETERSIFKLGFLTGLGFGISEFFLYVLVYRAPVFIRLFGILFHACNTSIVAFGLAKKRLLLFYLVAVFLHFSNNFLAIFGPMSFLGGITILILTYMFSLVLYKKTTEKAVD